jgi:hypothetical protein
MSGSGKYIEREAVCYQLAKQATIDGQPRAIRRAAKIVADFPAANVRPVVLCRDCVYSYDSVGGWCCSHGICVDCIVREDFFCADCEKREES